MALFHALEEIMLPCSHMNTEKKDQDHSCHLNNDHHTHHGKVDVILNTGTFILVISHILHIRIIHINVVIKIITARIAWTNHLQRIQLPVKLSLPHKTQK